VAFDAKWIRQVLLNLLTNAVAASSNRGIITIRSILRAPKWTVSVEDQGVGVPADKRNQIFERFVRLTHSEGSADRGTGLGLAICRSVVELHGGRIFATAPDAGPGLRVIFELPVADSAAEKPAEDDLGVRKSARAELTPVSR
jgi:signal transduction histidine kinase